MIVEAFRRAAGDSVMVAELQASIEQAFQAPKTEAAPVTQPAEMTTSEPAPAPEHVFRPLKNWHEVQLNGETISLRNRERAKEFLRMLWNKGAKRRSQAILVGRKFKKPSALFGPGARFIRKGAGNATVDVDVKSERGALIHRVYREAVGIVKPPRGTGPHRYYLRVFFNSDET
jgi:hypothetical protein